MGQWFSVKRSRKHSGHLHFVNSGGFLLASAGRLATTAAPDEEPASSEARDPTVLPERRRAPGMGMLNRLRPSPLFKEESAMLLMAFQDRKPSVIASHPSNG